MLSRRRSGETPRRRLKCACARSPPRTCLRPPSDSSLARLLIGVLHSRNVAWPNDRRVLRVLVDLVVLHQCHRRAHELVIGPVRLVAGREGVPAPPPTPSPLPRPPPIP